jgi:dihydrofolate reductase
MLSAIAVIGKNRELGYKNKLLWDIPEDMKHFKELTTGHTVVMGRKTFESIGKPLPNRKNIIITKNKDYIASGCKIIHSPEDLIKNKKDNEKIFIIGGGQIYKIFLPYTDKLYLTIVNDTPLADIFFPDYSEFKKVVSQKTFKNNKLNFTFFEFKK